MLHLQHLKLPHILHTQNQNTPTSLSHPIPKQCGKFSRRELTLFTNSSLLLLAAQTLQPHPLLVARAEEDPLERKGELLDAQGGENPQESQGELSDVQADENGQQSKGELSDVQAEDDPKENKREISDVQAQDNPQESKGELSDVKAEDDPTENKREISDVQAQDNDPQESKGELSEVQAEENLPDNKREVEQQEAETSPKITSKCTDKIATKRAFLDISIDGKPTGRIVIGLYEQNAPVGAARFSDLVSGKAGITFRRKEFVKIMPNYIQHGGIRSYGVDAELASRAGKSLGNDTVVGEWERDNEECPGTKNLAGTVSIIVRDPSKPPPKIKLVARQGKLQIDQEEIGIEPNGTEFTIATRDSPELDSSALVVGKVIQGMDVVEKIAQVKTVQENTSSPYFRVAKLIGDKRAVVAERGFNRPYSKVIITNCGLLE